MVSGFKNGRYDLTWTQAGRWHGQPRCSTQRDPDFLDQVFEHHLQPMGFERHAHASKAVLSVTGPGISTRRRTPKYEAIHNPPPRSTSTS